MWPDQDDAEKRKEGQSCGMVRSMVWYGCRVQGKVGVEDEGIWKGAKIICGGNLDPGVDETRDCQWISEQWV